MDEKRTALLRLLREARAGEGQRGDGRPDGGRSDGGRSEGGQPDAGRSDGGRLDVGWSDGGREAGARGGSRDVRPQAGAVAGIAVIGLAGRYPRAATPDELWVRTRDGEHCITEFPADRSGEGRSAEGRAGTRRWAGLIDDADAFDPLFFGIAPVDADGIDPQERVFLETVWAALEDAGHPPRRLARASNPVGVFAGVMNSDYEWMGGEATALGAANAARSSHWSIANRVSYVLDFRGPSLTVNTACSASLTAVHLACESLRSGECSVAVAGGVNLILHESHLRTLAENGMTSPGDRVRAFGKGADGFVDGEGVGAVVLKPLDRAIADGDRVYGVIRSSAVNSGGKTGGYTVPSPAAQAEVIRTSLRRAGIDPRTIGCVEAHGTGTPLGDPIEIAGLREAFAEHLDDSLAQGVERCAVGSVKSNIGHLESAAGIAGLTKMLMQLKHGTIAPSLNSGELNPDIDLAGTPFFVPQEAVAWERAEAVHTDGRRVVLPRRGAISSFGGGGANAHLIVEEYAGGEGYERGGSFEGAGKAEAAGRREGAGTAEAATSAGPHLVVLSARDDERLRVYAGRLADFLDADAAQGDDDAEATCLRLAAEVLGVDTADLDPLTPLHEYGCGAAELTRLAEKLDAEFGQGVHLTGATTLRDLAPAPAAAPTVTLADLAHTLQAGREELPARLAFPAGDLAEARALLRAYAAGEPTAEVVTGTAPAQRVAPDAGLQRALEQGDLRTVAEQWVRGAGVEWARNGGRRVGLPTYPFARKRYWLPRPAVSAAAVMARTAVTQKGVEPAESATTWAQSGVEPATTLTRAGVQPAPALPCYRPTWLPEPRPTPTPDPTPTPATPQKVLILTTPDATPLATGIARHHEGDDTRLIDLDRDDLVRAFTEAGRVDRVYHLGGITPGDLTTSHRRGVLALFEAARHLTPRGSRLHIKVVTNDACAAFGDPVTNPFAAGLHGLTRVLVKERPEIRAVCLDFAHGEPTPEDLLTAVLEEPCDATGRTVLLRHGARYVPALQPVDLPEPQEAPYREGGVYVVVGGTGGIGQELTLHLAERHRAKVVWISRSAPGPEQRACADRARELGGEVLHVRADCRDAEALKRAAREAKARFGAIHGVVHAAMTFDPGPLAALDEDAFTAALAVKAEGSVATDEAFGAEPLDFMVFFSSVGALVGTAGNGTYSCAGAVQDAYALHLDHRRPYPVRVIDWGYWGPVGSGARPGLREMFHGLGIGELTVPDGLSAIARTLGGRLPQVLPINADTAALTALGAAMAPPARQYRSDAPPTLRTAAPSLLAPRADDAPGVLSVISGYERLTEVCRPAVLGVLQGMGVLTTPGESHDRDQLADRLGVLPKFRRLYEALLNILEDNGYIESDGARVRLPHTARPAGAYSSDALEPQFDRIAADHPDLAPTVTLTRLFLRQYAEILRGEIRATEIMFPGSSMALVADFYKANPLTDSFNELVRDAVAVHLEHRIARLAPGERLRIVEFGAGTGATTDSVLPVLAPYADRVSYWFTDISQHFLDHAEARLRPQYDAPGFLNFRVLDLERGHQEQGFEPGTYDMVLATNVVHATADLRATLGKAKDLLRPGGWLVLNELTEVRDSTTVVGGVLDGWWLFDDGELRLPDSPLVHPDTWRRLLREQGFGDVTVTGGTGADGRARGQHVIVGESDGLRPITVREAVVEEAAAEAAVSAVPSGRLQGRLAAIVARCLKLDEDVDPEQPLASYGFDSLTGMKIVAGIADEFGVTVSLGDFYDHPTLRELAEYYAESGTLGDVAEGAEVSGAPGGAEGGNPAAAPATTVPVPVPSPLPPIVITDGPATDHPLSEGQRALWVIERMNPGTYAYNLPLAFRLDPGTDVGALRLALQSILDRHDSLRSTIRTTADGPVRTVAAWQELHFQHRYLAVTDEPAVRVRVREEARRPFDLEHGPLLRVTLFTQGDGGHVLLLAFHHIVFDGVSIAAFLRELTAGYREARAGRRPGAAPVEATFAEFTAWQRDLLAGPEGDRLRAYWLRRLDAATEPLALPYDRPRPQVPGYRGAAVEGRMDAELVDLARRFAAEKRTSLFAVLLSGYFTLLHRYTQQRGIRVGTPAAGRPSARFEDTLGYFMNMVVLQADVDPENDFGTLAGQVHRTVLEALEHAHLPLITLAETLRQAGRTDTADLFRTAFYFQNWVEPGDRDPVREVFHGVHQEGEFDVTLEVVEGAADCAYTLKYDPDLFDEATVRRLGEHFLALLRSALTEPARPVGRLPLLTGDERRQIERQWEQARRPYPRERTLPDLVEEQAARRPDALAVTSDVESLTYRQLAEKIDRLAGHLRAEGVRPGRAVGVLVERGHLPVALLAVLKAGGSYVPLDPTFPVDRLSYMAEDAGLHLVLTTATAESALGGITVPRLRLDQLTGRADIPGRAAGPDDTAYIIYTSGSTGRPKGVAVPHRALVNFLVSMKDEPGFGQDDTLLALTTVCFDIAALELYLPLITGGRVDIAPADVAKDGVKLRRHLESRGATAMQATPSTWKMLLATGWAGDPSLTALCGGEALDQDTADALVERTRTAWNLYGPTETTIWSAVGRLTPGGPVTLGRAVANTQLLVLDAHGQQVPPGVPGELHIGGDGLATGYVNRPDLTAERFVPNLIAPDLSPRLYRTGDLVRALPDGTLAYLGRADTQVKVRGYRVETGEVEAAMRRLAGVTEAVVVPAAAAGGNGVMLRGFYTGTGEPVDPAPLGAWLPEYMVPDVLVPLREFPQTLNAKTDRVRLGSAPLDELRAAYGESSTARAVAVSESPLVGELARLVAEVAEVAEDRVPKDRPLGELGLNSVGFTTLSTRIGTVLGVEVYPTAFYQYPTVTGMAAHLLHAHPELRARFGTQTSAAQAVPVEAARAESSAGIAVVGMAGRLPRSADLDAFWQHLADGDDLIQEIPADRWDWRAAEGSRSRWGGFVPDVDRFDAKFFGISPREAQLMDPQQRLVLETVWTALEDAAIRPSELAGRRVGVFLGVTNSDYLEVQRAAGQETDGHTITGAALSIIPNRVSYLLDLRGPSVAVDTACSSSLTAIHQAVSALRDGSCDLAIAGGVSLILDPSLYVALSKNEMLSEDGRCKAFDSRANGYVRGEGVGAVVLKAVDAAERDGDPVHAVIRGSAVNHGGRTNSLTAPSPDAQAEVITRAHRSAGTDPAAVGYIEAHGTGTALGDPIEVTGLRTAFTQLYEDAGRPLPAVPTVGLGSVKSNVGHLEGAAGMAGLFKVVLAMRHEMIPASLHVVEENRYLDLDGGPFRIVTEPTPWERAGSLPRRAGLSSFGFGGAGAHLVLEEAPLEAAGSDEGGPVLLVLSAHSKTALTAYAGRLAEHLREGRTALADVAHTLRVGREPMPQRLAFVAGDRAEALAALDAFAAGEPVEHSGRAGKGRAQSASWRRYLDSLITEHELEALAELFVEGEEFDWSGLADGASRVRIPTYVFDRTRHWVESGAAVIEAHPLLDTVDPGECVKRLTGNEFYLRDHLADGTPILPGVVLLEMARAAAELTCGDGQLAKRVEDVTWAAPIRTGAGDVTVRIKLDRQPGRTGFEVLTGGGRPHATGTVVTAAKGERRTLDLGAVEGRCSGRTTGAEYYRRVDATGFHYGPSFQVVEWLATGDREALARLVTPAHLREDASAYRFHPALMDAALQTAGSIATGEDDPAAPAHLPYSVGAVELLAERLPESGHAHARRIDDGSTPGVRVFDILVTDDDGVVAARIERFTLRALPSAKSGDEPLVAFEPYWRESAPAPAAPLRTVLLVDGARRGIGARVAERTGARVVSVEPGAGFEPSELAGPVGIVHLAGDGFHEALALCRAWISRSGGEARYLYVHPEGAPEHAAISGLARAVRGEYPGLRMSAVACPADADLVAVIAAELGCAEAPVEVRTDGVRRLVGAWRPAELPATGSGVFAAPGAHIVTGGTGGIGLHLTERLASHGADIVLASRNQPSAEVVERVARLAGTGARILHVAADVTRREDVAALVHAAREHSGRIAGVLHAAGVLRDGFVLRKNRDEADAVIAPKMLGVRWLDEETREEELEYFAAFSSTAAALSSVGQSDYSYANAYLDHFVLGREQLRARGERFGLSLSVNWPLWRDGGMTMDTAAQQAMRRELGFGPLATGVALDGLERALGGAAPRLLLAAGDAGVIQRALESEHAAPRGGSADAGRRAAGVGGAALQEAAEGFLRELLAGELKMPVEEIDSDEQFDRYGIDSLLVLSLTRELEARFGELSKTLFFEYFTVAELAGYFVEQHGEKLAELVEGPASAADAVVEEPVAAVGVEEPVADAGSGEAPSAVPTSVSDDDIVIIGVSGRYPGADDLREFWRNLREGVDSVEEIPGDRWDHARWFDPDRDAVGKSYSKWGGFLRDVDRFDPLFFRMSQVEAEHIDPQERIFLETVWHLLEDAGVTRSALAGSRTGVFVGMMYGHYQLYGVEEALRGEGAATSSSYASVANRVSYFFDLDGPSVGLDTMCSSSLTAMHLAAQAIRAGDCDTAVAGGVNISSHPLKYLQLSRGGFLSTDGRCRSFGADGDGYVPAEGAGAVLLKRRSAAERDGDRILAVVKASAVNHGGAGKGFSVPNARAQGDLIGTALARAGWTAADLDYIEAHGTGTSLGDPIEVTGLLRAFGGQDLGGRKIPIGSVKSNIGHAESAAGMAAVTKVLLQLRHGQLAPSLHADPLNPNIDFESAPLRVQRDLTEWAPRVDAGGRPLPRTAAVSAFGAGGSNAHVLLEEYVPAHPRPNPQAVTPYVCTLSARDADQLGVYAADLADFLRADGKDTHPASLAYTLQAGREAMAHRVAVVYEDRAELLGRLDALVKGNAEIPGVWTGVVRRNARGAAASGSEPRALAAAWAAGEVVDWRVLYEVPPPRVELPGYPFAGVRCWYGSAVTEAPEVVRVKEEFTLTSATPVVAGHRVSGRLLLPALAYVDLVHQAFRKQGFAYDSLELRDLTVLRPLAVTAESPVRITLDAERSAPDRWTIRIAEQGGQAYATAELVSTGAVRFPEAQPPAVPSPSAVVQDLGAVYDRDAGLGQVYSGAVRAGGQVWRDEEQLIAELTPPPGAAGSGHLFHPGLMLGGAVAAGALLADVAEGGFFLPMYVESFRAAAPLNGACTARVLRSSVSRRDEIARITVEFLSGDGRKIAELRGMASKLIRSEAPRPTGVPTGGTSLTVTEDRVRRLIADALNRDAGELEPTVGYYELGIDSVSVLDLVGQLERELGKSLPPTLLFEYTTIRDLAAYLDEHHPVAAQPPAGTRLLTKEWEPAAAGPRGQLPSPVALLATPGSRALADRLARELPDAEVVTDLSAHPDRFRACVDLTGCAHTGPVDGRSYGGDAWLPWLQRLVSRASAAEPVVLLGVTRGLEGGERIDLAGAERAGLYRMLQSEYANVRSRHVDLDPLDDDVTAVRQLVAELADAGEEPEVRHRAGQRQRAVLRENPGVGGLPPFSGEFGADEALVITGGTGGLGLAFARYAVQHWGVRRLVLIGRSRFPDRAEWEARRGDDVRFEALLGLERAGADVRVVSLPLDGSASGQLERVVRESGAVGGVIHCAGVADRENLAFIGKPGDAVGAVVTPKVAGLDALVAAFAGHPLRFFAICSSVAAAVPSAAVGQSDYAMANAYQDYLAAARPHGLPLLSVQWPSWSGVGMGDENPGPAYLRTGLGSVTETEGTALLDHLLRRGAGPVVLPAVVHDADWSPELLTGRRIEAERAEAVVRKPVGAGKPVVVELVGGEAVEAAGSWLLGLIAEQLHFDAGQLAVDVPIEDFGTDSIVMVQLLRKVGGRLGVEVDPTAFIEHPTVEGFVGWLAAEHPGEFAAAFADEGGAEDAGPFEPGPAAEARPVDERAPDDNRPRDGGIAAVPVAQHDAVEPASPVRHDTGPHDIAVIGMSGRFPGAPDLDAYWKLLSEGRSAISPVPPARWGGDGSLVAGLVERDGFDPAYFLLSDEDAEAMDPQALVLLEETLFALADAGYAPADVKGQEVGVYVGARSRHLPDDETLSRTRNPIVAVGQNYLAANVSRFFDLRGPSVVVDTACSSALVALHSAAQALRDGDAEAAVVGGVTLLADDAGHRLFDQRGVLSPEPAFHAFDRRARGTVLAEGAGVVVLKPLDRALADGDRVQAVLKGIAVNNDGRTAGPASPNPVAQRAVMAKALARSGKRAEDVTHIETNAAGSAVHDLVELKAIQAVYRDGSRAACSLGSVKPNIGHPQCAEGIAGLIKVVLMLRERQLVPFLSGQEPPEHFDFAATPFMFARETRSWPHAPLVAAVSCFADGGTNAHAVVEGWSGPGGGRAALKRPELARRMLPGADAGGGRPRDHAGERQAAGTADRQAAVAQAREAVRSHEPGPVSGPVPVAVIGLAGRYPGADDVTAFWRNLVEGHDAVTEIPADRWEWRAERTASRWGGFVSDADRFDAEFFRIPRAEAEITDPQERLFLQTCWAAIEDAGYTPATLVEPRGPERRRVVGVFAGAMHKDYALIGAQAAEVDGKRLPVSLNQGMIANRVSYVGDFHGPSMAVDSLCSASLTTVHLAVESIARGESEVAIAGGVNLSLHPAKYHTYGAVDMHSTTGRSRSFGADADGWVSSEGVGAVVLKPLDAAERDGDHVYAVIRSTAVSHVGAGSGVTVPSPVAQAAVVSDALDKAGIDARTIGCVEAHGTGTKLGDPIELQGLVRAFRRHTGDTGFCALGSVKSNIGHAESAGGVAGLTKAVLQLHHRTLVPTLHSETANPLLSLDDTPFRLQHDVRPWPEPEAGTPRRAGISSYGATGSHAHVVLEEYTPDARLPLPGPQIVPLSARDGDRLREAAERLLAFLSGEQTASLAELAHTLQVGRVPMASRAAFVAGDLGELQRALDKYLAGGAGNPWGAPGTPEDIERWLADGRLTDLADHWTAGGDLDWRRLWPGARPRRVPLPTYPFARERHWHPGVDGGR
ncbi:non-ribosomal peptide synthetase [Streptomyces sp. ST1015]|uniref:non-ribosomal peptide synthetase n=1 Tax=Streptomyces sp. ST1015 TaxID=1848900 RepID=UPI001CA6DF5E|nr:non-ribosomal peptide synthetase [Streptomyces sp. ST1015]QZZ32132.1 amino acid adenylation domain-containing protein [Streptomyces sp. ST1015]